MGYTRYFKDVRTNDGVARDVRKIFQKARERGIVLRGPMGTGEPIISHDEIVFNGNKSTGDDYETFDLHNDESLHQERPAFCKTARKPYDAVVVAVLLSAHSHGLGMFRSDGFYNDEQTIAGIELFEKAVRPLYSHEWEALSESLAAEPIPQAFSS